MKKQKILIAEDDVALQFLLVNVMENEGYEVTAVQDGLRGLEALDQDTFDLVISDINMPFMNGFEFLGKVKEKFPKMHRIIMTAYNVDDYMSLVQEHNIGNIVTKGLPFNTSELILVCEHLLSRKIFGLKQYMEPDTTIVCDMIRTPDQIDKLSKKLTDIYGQEKNARKLNTVLLELLTNALFYGAKNENAENKADWDKDFILPLHQAIKVCHGRDSLKTGFSILDHGGKLDQKTILYWLDRQLTPGTNGLPQGIFDSHGRGLFIARQYVDRLIVNVERGVQCECIILNYSDEPPTTYKPVLINEI